jgi:Co/Zn/Cd efflux system component
VICMSVNVVGHILCTHTRTHTYTHTHIHIHTHTHTYAHRYNPEYHIADPICTFFFSLLVIFTTVRLVRQALGILMEGTPEGIDVKEIKAALHGIEGACLSMHVYI